jgi:class 3 adenylate cyclase
MAQRKDSFSFDVDLPVEQVWSVVADTQKMNELVFGLRPSTIVARDVEKARIRGTFGMFAPEYDEYPWAFQVPHHYRSARVFPRGVLRRFEFDCRLASTDGGTRLTLESTIEGAEGIVGRVAVGVFARRLAASVSRLEGLFRAAHATNTALGFWRPSNPDREAVLARARPLAESVRPALTVDEGAVLDRLVDHIASATEADAARIRPYELADHWGVPRRTVLTVTLRAAHAGLLRLSWDLLCPSCEAPTSVEALKDLPAGGHCPACDVDFRADFDKNVEPTFRPEPAVRAAERVVFCHGSPSSTPSWIAQFVVPARSTHELSIALGAGRYRVQGAGLGAPLFVDVDEQATSHELKATIARISDGGGAVGLRAAGTRLAPGTSAIVVDNAGDEPRRVQIAWRAYAAGAATAADVTGVGLFHELFGADVLAPTQHVDVGQRTILFTDLVGSTAMYERIGDAAAYGMVRRHFELLGAAVERHNGHVVKTVGDAVMAAFDLPIDGARAGLECIEALRGLKHSDGTSPDLKLRVGVHSGPCLAVDANAHVDYFGRTVNIAARVEGLGGPDELVLSWSVRAAGDVAGFVDELRHAGHDVVDEEQRVKGIAAPVAVTRVRVKSANR